MYTASITTTSTSSHRLRFSERFGGVCPLGLGRPPGSVRLGCLSLLFCSQCMLAGCLSIVNYLLSGPPTCMITDKTNTCKRECRFYQPEYVLILYLTDVVSCYPPVQEPISICALSLVAWRSCPRLFVVVRYRLLSLLSILLSKKKSRCAGLSGKYVFFLSYLPYVFAADLVAVLLCLSFKCYYFVSVNWFQLRGSVSGFCCVIKLTGA